MASVKLYIIFGANLLIMTLSKPKQFYLSGPEKWFQDILDKLTPVQSTRLQNTTVYKLDGKNVMLIDFTDQDRNSGDLYLDYTKIWSVFKDRFHMNNEQIQALAKELVERQYNLRVVLTQQLTQQLTKLVERQYNLRVVLTACYAFDGTLQWWRDNTI